MKRYKACKLTYNGKRYYVSAFGEVSEIVGEDPHFPSYTNFRFCDSIESEAVLTEASRLRKNKARRDKHAVLTSLGLKRVKGALGGTYYE